ncbi:MAG: hypothetical protein JXA95_17520, partial [Spirochaetales bacterium]|nr:hypothetical protein [Spirochaetales bacterium]
ETGSLLSYYLNRAGIGSYVLSGDNYPRRIPSQNDAERLRIFRYQGVLGLVQAGLYDNSVREELARLWEQETDGERNLVTDRPWLSVYQRRGREALEEYLGSPREIDFDEINRILSQFKGGEERILLKRMGREPHELWYEKVDFSAVSVLVIEWTHGNNPYLEGVDVPILLNSTPEETLAHRRARNRDGKTDSPFTTMVLEVEQEKLKSQASRASIIVTKSGELVDYPAYLKLMNGEGGGLGPMLNAYPDSIGGRLGDILTLMDKEALKGAFQSFYVLPSIYNTDLDRGFSVIDYGINESYASFGDLKELSRRGIDLKLDFILNHASVLSPQFQDIVEKGRGSRYADFFIDWNKFWEGCGIMGEEGHIVPDESYTRDMFFRKPGLPLLNVRVPGGEEIPYWNTFYQSVTYDRVDARDIMKSLPIQYAGAEELAVLINDSLDRGIRPGEMDLGRFEPLREDVADLLESGRKYLGQMDLNIKSPLVWEFYEDTLKKLASYGARIVRLDAFAYAPKEPGKRNFLNEPDTWDLLDRVKTLADRYGLRLLPEIHSRYEEKIHEKITEQGYMTYDFFLPGLLIDAMERKTWAVLKRWIGEILEKGIGTVNMLGCHDGIPLLDLKGLLTDEQIQNLIDAVVSRGGYVKDLHGKKNIYYQVNATYYSALGEDDRKMLLARAVQMFMPGKPQVWYLDIFAGRNDHDGVKRAGEGGHKEINRTNLTLDGAAELLESPVVKDQLSLLKFRNSHPAFCEEARITLEVSDDSVLKIRWESDRGFASLAADLGDFSYRIDQGAL